MRQSVLDRWPESTTPEEWRAAFEKFKAKNPEIGRGAVKQFSTMLLGGFVVLSRKGQFDECIALAEWAVEQPIVRKTPELLPEIHYYKSLALIKSGRQERALSYFLTQARNWSARNKHMSQMVLFGIVLLQLIHPQGQSDKGAAPAEIVAFTRGLFLAIYPDRKLPVGLNDGGSWAEVHKGLAGVLR